MLDLSKLVMYRLRYGQLANYARRFNGSISVVAGDTDSLFLEVEGISVLHQLLPAMKYDDLLDSSNYPQDHPLYSVVGKAQLGRIKDECSGKSITDAVFLRPKCYSIQLNDKENHRRAKGIQRAVLKNSTNHDDYIKVS